MAILKPEWHVTLVESSQRKAVFLRESSRTLQNVSVLAERMEDVCDHGDWVVTRAVDPKEVLRTVPRLAPNIGLMLGEDDFSIDPAPILALRGRSQFGYLGETEDSAFTDMFHVEPATLRSTWNTCGKSHSNCKSKGRGRQNHHRHQPGCIPGSQRSSRSADRLRSPRKRDHRPWNHQGRGSPDPLPSALRRGGYSDCHYSNCI